MNTTVPHTYRVGKFGATVATVYVDGVRDVFADESAEQLPSEFFVVAHAAGDALERDVRDHGQDVNANATVSYVTYAFHATPKP